MEEKRYFDFDQDEMVSLSPSAFIETLTKTITKFDEAAKLNHHPAVFIRGQPGIGKSDAVKALAKNIENLANKKVVITDIRLLMFNPVDLRGIPIPDQASQTALWLKPSIFKLSEALDTINIFFMDELTSAPQSLQAAAYQIALDRRIGEHVLPNNTVVIAAGNRSEDYAVTYSMPSALKNRFIHFNLAIDVKRWIEWAKHNNIHPEIIEFIETHSNLLSTTDFDSDKAIIVTPRSWEIASELLQTMGGSPKDHANLLASVLGTHITKLMLKPPEIVADIEAIINGENDAEPQSLSEMQFVVNQLVTQVRNFIEDKTQTTNVLSYLLTMPVDFALQVFRIMVRHTPETYALDALPEYNQLLNQVREHHA